ncbi:ribosomal protein S15 [Rhinocladiella mackenziei CBS 650.93]|uniref:Ribosomal protein S15 n=1 Tax=Rhinocladiella mackenziei CBS 650.93 TaxID=1442369 RepID=A0A0D2FMK5_9EURO|nr:ribosomal protein S15 [Rhinocladiella mackenziei CBS 650.93]KIX03242.1 ribosomal protein S15 [Rhinocladiella mackenziei CBS 650.93]
MPPRASPAVTSSIFNLTSLLQSLPSVSRNQALTKCSTCLFSTTAPLEAKRAKKRKVRKHTDPYRLAQARQRKSANEARQKVLQTERKLAMGDPIRSRPTPFVNSLRSNTSVETIKESYLNYFLKKEDMDKSLEYSKWLTEPLPEPNPIEGVPYNLADKIQKHAASHENASKALLAIAALENGSSKDRTRVNIQRCIEEFGRHNTDGVLAPRLQGKSASGQTSVESGDENAIKVPKHVGQDTGSSEVQIAILTAKINVLADNLHKKDKANKRSLRLMVHRRQKLMAYLRKQDRGGARWQNLVEKLGLSDAMWKGEISL